MLAKVPIRSPSHSKLGPHLTQNWVPMALGSSAADQLRRQLEDSVSLSASPLLDASREEFSLNVEEDPTSPPRPQPSPPSPHKCPAFVPCGRLQCKLRRAREKEKEALNKTCRNCDVKLYSSMCCAKEKELCEDCLYELGVCT